MRIPKIDRQPPKSGDKEMYDYLVWLVEQLNYILTIIEKEKK